MIHITIHSGAVCEVLGLGCQSDKYVFVPVLFFGDLPARTELSHTLQDHVRGLRLPALELFCDDYCGLRDSGWVRARLPRLFGFTPPGAPAIDPKLGLVECSFVALERDLLEGECPAYCFACVDTEELESGILFFTPPPSPEIQLLIAQDFWKLLCRNPDDLSDFDDFVLVGTDVDRSPCRVAFTHGQFSIEQIGDAIG